MGKPAQPWRPWVKILRRKVAYLSTINFQLSTQCIALTGRSNLGKRTGGLAYIALSGRLNQKGQEKMTIKQKFQ
jgi:hypothetical protein